MEELLKELVEDIRESIRRNNKYFADSLEKSRAFVAEVDETLAKCRQALADLNERQKSAKKEYHYNLVSANEEKLFPNCVEDYAGYFSRYSYDSVAELFPGDYIRVTDDNYNIGMAKVIKRISSGYYNGQITLVCENVDPEDDYVFSVNYEEDVKQYIKNHRKSVTIGEMPDSDFIGVLMDSLTMGKTTVDHVIVIQRTHKILAKILKYGEYAENKSNE